MQPGDRLGQFEILTPLGHGGMGEVWRARDTRLKRDVALKLLPPKLGDDPERLARLQREAEMMAAVGHPNVAVLHGLEESEHNGSRVRFLVLELVDGVTLAERLQRGALEPAEALRLGREIACALEAAHERGIVHRDLKPDNVMITAKGRVKVLDFGIAKAGGGAGASTELVTEAPALTATGVLVGTTPYMSPEQIRGAELDARTDVWAFGCLLYEMLTRRQAFSGSTAADVMSGVLERDPEWAVLPATLPTAARTLLERCLEKDPRQRIRDAGELRTAIESIGAGASEVLPIGAAPARRNAGLDVRGLRPALVAVLILIGAWTVGRRWFEEAGTAMPRVSMVRTLVALPTEADGDDGPFVAGASSLSSSLVAVPDLAVRYPPPTRIELDRLGSDLTELAELFQVDAFLMSSVSRIGDEVELSVQIVKADDRTLLWAEEFRGAAGEGGALLQRAGSAVANAVRPELTVPLERRSNPEAEAELQVGAHYARLFNNTHDKHYLDIAERALERTLELQPATPEAAARMAFLNVFRFEAEGDPALIDEIARWADLAIALDAEDGWGWTARSAAVLYNGGDLESILRPALRATKLSPLLAEAHLTVGIGLGFVWPELSLVSYSRAAELDPLHLYPHLNTVGDLGLLGRYAQALPDLELVLRLEPELPAALFLGAESYSALGRFDRAEEMLALLRHLVAEGKYPEHDVRAVDAYHRLNRALAQGRSTSAEVSELRALVRDLTVTAQPTYLAAVRSLAAADHTDAATAMLDLALVDDQFRFAYAWFEQPEFVSMRRSEAFLAARRRALRELLHTVEMLERARAEGLLPDYLEAEFLRLRTEVPAESVALGPDRQ